MTASPRFTSIVLLTAHQFVSSLNPCMIDKSACVPLEDFEVYCTCILTHGEPYNATDDVYMFFMGHQFPLNLFKQVKMPGLFRKKLGARIPSERDFEASLEMPETIYRNLHFEEDMALFLINSSMSSAIVRLLINESLIRTDEMRENSNKWCAEGECAAFVNTEKLHNRTAGIYAQDVDLLHIIEMGSRSVVAVSSVHAEFEVPKVHHLLCESKCKRFYWNEGILCRQQCQQGLRYDQVAVTGTLKRDFVNFVRASAVHNFRTKYAKYINRHNS